MSLEPAGMQDAALTRSRAFVVQLYGAISAEGNQITQAEELKGMDQFKSAQKAAHIWHQVSTST